MVLAQVSIQECADARQWFSAKRFSVSVDRDARTISVSGPSRYEQFSLKRGMYSMVVSRYHTLRAYLPEVDGDSIFHQALRETLVSHYGA